MSMMPAVPTPTPETAPFWDAALEGRLVIQRCDACEHWVFHPRVRCPYCGADALRWEQASGRGRLWSYIIVHRAEAGFEDRVPYVIATIELEEGPRMMGTVREIIPEASTLPIDLPVVVRFEDRGDQAVPYWVPEAVA